MSQPAAAQLIRGLGLRDVTLLGIACIVGTRWLATAAHAGPGSVTLFLLAGLFFVGPTAQAIGVLATRMPGAGGQYVWARDDFGDWHGFLAFWLYWVGIASWVPNAALAYVSIAIYAINPAMIENRALIVTLAVIAIWTGVGVNLLGVRIGRWNQNAGSLATWLMALLLMLAAFTVYWRQGPATELSLIPPMGLDTLNLWSQIAFAVTGIELLGMMGEEIRDPGRTIRLGGWIAGLAGVLFYCVATFAILVLQKPEETNVLFGIMQAAQVGATRLDWFWLPALFAVFSVLSMLGQLGGIVSATARLSFAAARDGLLPPVFARIHPKWQTPHVSMFALAFVATALLLLMQLGDTMRAAYQELVSMMVLGSFPPFLYIFGSAWKAGLRWAPVSGIFVILIALAFSVLPTEDISNVWLFEAKILGGSLFLLGLGRWTFQKGRRMP
ncbi:MAG: APC family permease [Acidobacteria bacterium]|nr:APC family permease [Acidobacteriota bacterium]